MLIKEYRIGLPMSVEEYRIAQLYMIQRKSREESHGEGSGVEILVNEPYKDGPGGDGQYTYKIYHIGSHLPSWFRAILPKSALRVEEEAWNAYPYTKTRYRCPFIEKFLLEIETKYLNDNGKQDNIFCLNSSELKNRQLDYLDIVKDPISSGDYKKEEDPKIFKSTKTGRGPLTDNWREEYSSGSKNKSIMTAYKLCKVEFRYWGMQNKIERFIHDIALRKTMLRAHRQAWCWQDEWYGLKLVDIRRLEKETQMALAEKMADVSENGDMNTLKKEQSIDNNMEDELKNVSSSKAKIPISVSSDHVSGSSQCLNDTKDSVQEFSSQRSLSSTGLSHKKSLTNSMKCRSGGGSSRDISTSRMFESLEQLQESSSDEEIYFDAKGYVSSMEEMDFWSDEGSECTTSESEEEEREQPPLIRSSSIDLVTSGDEYADAMSTISEEYTDTPLERKLEQFRQHYSIDHGKESSPPPSAGCKSSILFLVVHGGNILDSNTEHLQASKRSDFSTVKSTFEQVIRTHYPGALGHIAFRLVPCPQICTETLSILSSLSPYVCDAQTPKSPEAPLWSQEFIPLGAIALFASSNPDYHEFVNKMVAKANLVYRDFLSSDEGKGFTGQVCLLADATGSLLTYDALCLPMSGCYRGMSTYDSHTSLNEPYSSGKHDVSPNRLSNSETNRQHMSLNDSYSSGKHDISPRLSNSETSRQLSQSDPDLSKNSEPVVHEDSSEKQFSKSDIVSAEYKLKRQSSSRYSATYLNVNEQAQESSRRTSTGSYFDSNYIKFDFEVTDVFMLGSPLGLVLSYRRMFSGEDKTYAPPGPACHQLFNLFHASDPTAVRLEPLIHQVFKHIAPIRVSRYNKFPLGDGEPVHVVEAVQNNLTLFTENRRGPSLQRHGSLTSLTSQMSGLGETTVSSITNVTSRWWGNKRLDYMLYCPEVLHSFPVAALPHLFHASFWESCDVIAFILRQVLRHDILFSEPSDKEEGKLGPTTVPSQPKEKWLKRRTTIKVKNLQANHRGNDALVLEDKPQKLTARFMYGSFDVTSLSGERVDIHVMEQPTGEWKFLGTALTDKHGKLQYTIPTENSLPQGMHPVKIVVRGDHSTADFFLTVLPPKTETVVFSIDGSFTASMSISGKDPKVRAGAVDVVRHWQDQGYLILYVTARPDMQHRKVVSWLAMHNFPHGMVAFMDGLSKEPLKQKRNYLKSLKTEADILFKAGYGSSKDIYVYKELGLTPEQIFIVGKTAKKLMSQAQVLSGGYADHLCDLLTPGTSRPATGNARHFIQKGCFSKPSQSDHSKKAVKRLSSNHGAAGEFLKQSDGPLQTTITVGQDGNTVVQIAHRGASQTTARPKTLKDVPR